MYLHSLGGGTNLVVASSICFITSHKTSSFSIHRSLHILLFVHSNGGTIDLLEIGQVNIISHFVTGHHRLPNVYIQPVNTYTMHGHPPECAIGLVVTSKG